MKIFYFFVKTKLGNPALFEKMSLHLELLDHATQ